MKCKYYNDVEQGSDEWLGLRLAALTASDIAPIFIQNDDVRLYERGGISHIRNKVDELLFREIKHFETEATKWGHDHEDEAVEKYEEITGNKTTVVGFAELEPGIACSPDRLVGEDGLLEIKCPFNQTTHQGYVKKGEAPKKYLYQMLHQLYVTQREWVDFFSYDPRDGTYLLKRYTGEDLCALLGETKDLYSLRVRQTAWLIRTIYEMVTEILDKRDYGIYPNQRQEEEPDDVEYYETDEEWD